MRRIELLPGEDSAALLARLERLTGRAVRSRADLLAYVEERAESARMERDRLQVLKTALLAGLVLVAGLQYYLLDVQLEILSQPSLMVFVPLR